MDKLGFGATSTVWLGRILPFGWRMTAQSPFSKRPRVALKLFVDSKSIRTKHDNKVKIYKCIKVPSKEYPSCGPAVQSARYLTYLELTILLGDIVALRTY